MKSAPVCASKFALGLGRRVRRQRRRNGWTLADVSGTSGLSKTFLSDIENGKSIISAYNLLRLARVLGVSVAWLIGEEERP